MEVMFVDSLGKGSLYYFGHNEFDNPMKHEDKCSVGTWIYLKFYTETDIYK